MEAAVAWILTNYGGAGLVGILIAYVWWDGRARQATWEQRYVALVDGQAEVYEATQDKYVNIVEKNIQTIEGLKNSHERLRDLIDERCPPYGRR